METMQAYEQGKVDGWQQTREITYVIYCANTELKDRVSKQEFMPLPGDVTTAAEDSKQSMVARWKKLGLL